jgi:hypothetical protein
MQRLRYRCSLGDTLRRDRCPRWRVIFRHTLRRAAGFTLRTTGSGTRMHLPNDHIQ